MQNIDLLSFTPFRNRNVNRSTSANKYLLAQVSMIGLKKPILKKKLPEAGAFVYLSITNQNVKWDFEATFFKRNIYIYSNLF